MADIRETTDKVRDVVPPELQGFIIAAIVVVGIMAVMTLFFWLMRHRLQPAEITEGAAEHPAGKKALPSKKERQKTRDAARAMGFIVDDVERDVPVELDSAAHREELQRRTCARYVFPEHVELNEEWALLRRPWRMADDQVGNGWQLERRKDAGLSEAALKLIQTLTREDRWQSRFLEIELARNTLTFYWDEFGGKREVQNLKAYQDSLKKVSAT